MSSKYLRDILISLSFSFSFVLAPSAGAYDDSEPSQEIINGSFFLHYHPDIRFRNKGMEAFESEDFEEAMKHFMMAAKYSDKPSQGMIGEMLWRGDTGRTDRAQAYAWMDLAAERGYVLFVARREQYWNALTEDERKNALSYGESLYADYGDHVAKERLAHKLRKGRSKTTGSRAGYVGNLRILVSSPSGMAVSIPASKVYDPRFWREKDYFAWQDRIWSRPPRGVVEVGPLSTEDVE